MIRILSLAVALLLPTTVLAKEELSVKIDGKTPSVTVKTPDGDVKIMRNQDAENTINPAFAKTSRNCPPFCVQPMEVAPGVKTVGELELLAFAKKGGKVVDSRTLKWYLDGTIPGSVHMPYTEMASRLNEIGCKRSADKKWDCSKAETVLLFCNGPWCGQSPLAIKAMLREGYPANKILYYRGGMQLWHVMGLTTVEGDL